MKGLLKKCKKAFNCFVTAACIFILLSEQEPLPKNQSSDILQHSQTRPTGDRWLTLSMPAGGGGGIPPPPLKFFLHNSKTPGHIKKKLSEFNFTPLTDILRILSIIIVVRCCHSNLLFSVCHVIFWVEKQRNLNYFQDNYLIKRKLRRGAIFRP